MKEIYKQLEAKFKEINALIEDAGIMNLQKNKEQIYKITKDNSIILAIRDLEGLGLNATRSPILLAQVKEKEEVEQKRELANLKLEVERLERELKSAKYSLKNTKGSGRRESLTTKKKEEIREIYQNKEMSMPQLAKKYRVSVGLIHKVINAAKADVEPD